MSFPTTRMRRLRASETIRRMVRETTISPDNLVYPIFVQEGKEIEEEIKSMPGIFRLSADKLAKEAKEAKALGIPAVILFGIPEKKDELASESYNPNGIVQLAIKEIKNAVPDLQVITDVCICEYASHGHCGVVRGEEILNDPTLPVLAKVAVSHAKAGADMVAPSDMMDGRIGAIRKELDEKGFINTGIISYAVKYASAFYGPFRDACDSAPQFGNRRTYQMDPANRREAIREAELDIEEGADIIMVKPAMAYLDIVREVRDAFDIPVAAYNVSGEYAMLVAAAERGWIDRDRTIVELLTNIRRAGADMIFTYFAKEAAKLLG
ncbi:MAG: porphobilinogen synthase [Nitrospinota bacterium]|nr:porphobilinogen synthase [Nitrospinota bacterium]